MYKMNMKYKRVVVIACLGLAPALSFASGFGVSNTSQDSSQESPAVQALLQQEQASVPSTMVSNAIMHPDSAAATHDYLAKMSKTAAAASGGSQYVSATAPTQTQSAENNQSQEATPAQAGSNALGDTDVNKQAFANVAKSVMPLSPQQLITLRKLFNQSQKAIAQYPTTPPKPTSSSVMVNLAPGAAPPIVRLRAGRVSALVFVDSTGQPWPIQFYDIGDPKTYNVEWNKKNNILLVQSSSMYKSGNLAVMLKGQDTPIMITLMPGQNAVDYRVDMRVPGLGPNAQPDLTNLAATANPNLLTFLDGVPPHGAKAVQVDGGPCEAWTFGGHLYLRTRLTVLSPSWMSSMRSPDGTHVYELVKTPVVLASFRGQITQLTIQG